ncbi:MAG: MmcQ/YjbR family DNA-binding protein [Pseudomonadales bacterium]|nr:MmcQ/YjbR family DNA-binding protein [Pseudomonadales bacterium]MDP6471924.1 MmcQ/YjbR family DNA-binding protein [Pseudomonadales bacterium]MDP6826806.1 MmcQ/YjbR family DNA-binding protein [Pseudomonadales bacterium]MDP6970916.1 MmcQ/YjbR family DNA-binding protein [Pseudomonadales bacterium]
MNFDAARAYLTARPEAIEDFPFGPDVYVYKILGKMFATLSEENQLARMNLKCDPHEALILRDIFDAVVPGYHMNKTHWNTVYLDGTIPEGELQRMIDASYSLVVSRLTRKQRSRLRLHHGDDAL